MSNGWAWVEAGRQADEFRPAQPDDTPGSIVPGEGDQPHDIELIVGGSDAHPIRVVCSCGRRFHVTEEM